MPYKVSDLIPIINDQIDDQESDTSIIAWINEALAEISTETNTILPLIATVDDGFVIPDRWVLRMIVTFAAGRAKQKDSSQFEYTDAYNQFYGALTTFVQKYQMPDDYKILVIGQEITKNDGTTYITGSEDTLGLLAESWGTTVDQIKSDNPSLKFVTNMIEGDIYNDPPYPWFNAF